MLITLLAGMGRILDGVTGIAVYVLHISALSAPAIIGIDIVLLIGMIVAMVASGDFTLSSASRRQEEAQKIEEIKEVKEIKNSSADTFDALCGQCMLTERETEVLQKLLFTEDDLQTIADSLHISRRVLSRHITSIYQKTGAKSRVGLYQIYHDACLNI